MTSSLASRLGEIPGVASVVVDLDGFGRGIDVRLEPGADEAAVMEKMRALLAAYGVRQERQAPPSGGQSRRRSNGTGVEVSITPINGGARIEVATTSVKSFRIVAADPFSVTQGLSDAWCQVIGRIPIEITDVNVDDDGRLSISAFDGEHESRATADVSHGWVEALVNAVADVLGDSGVPAMKRAAS